MLFALRVLRLAESLPRSMTGQTIARQVARCGTSVAANDRAASRGKSTKDFVHKITIVLEETDETSFWIELSFRAGLLPPKRLAALKTEAEELVKIFSATRRTAIQPKS